MSTLRQLVVASSVIVVLLASAAPAGAAPFTINVRGSADSFGRVLAIGDFKPQRDATYGAAISAFGLPSSERRTAGYECKVGWHGRGVKVRFWNLAGVSPCSEEGGLAQSARVYDERWRTVKGLRVGNRLARLRRLYPSASRHGRVWWLVTGYSLFGDGGRYAVLAATVRGGRVRSFSLWIGAAGE